jgi:hypothetical protein
MPRSTRSIIFSIVVLAATALTVYLLSQLDHIVHGQLYDYGLRFDYAWADPYWNILRIIQVLLAVAGATAAINLVLTVRKDMPSKKTNLAQRPQKPQKASSPIPTVPHMIERQAAPSQPTRNPIPNAPAVRQTPPLTQTAPATPTPQIVSAPTRQQPFSESAGSTICPHCNKAFSQPLRMMDFQGDRPRIVDICPFCNEIIHTAPKQENEEHKRFLFNGRNGHSPKSAPSQSSN